MNEMAKNDTPKELLQALDMIRETKGPKLESLDPLESTQVRQIRTIFEDRNIVGIGISEKMTDNKETGHLGLTFYVEKKVPKSRIEAGRLIPPVMSVADRKAVFTDVKQIGKVLPQVGKRRSRAGTAWAIATRRARSPLLS